MELNLIVQSMLCNHMWMFKEKRKLEKKEQIIKAGSFRDWYDDKSDPLYDTAVSEDSGSEM